MGRTTVILLFSQDKNKEPPGLLQCDTSGEYYPYYFNDWRHAVHYIQWCVHQNNRCTDIMFNEWGKLYGYDEEEEFNGDLNEFKTNDKDSWGVWVCGKIITADMDLNTVSAWEFDFDSLSDEESDTKSTTKELDDESNQN
jgi:hypothetical protein